MEKKMLYIMHISWGWIKQRPHFLAEGLLNKFDVTVITDKNNRKLHKLKKSKSKDLRIKEILVIPFSRFILIKKINNFIRRIVLKKQIKINKIIWYTNPDLVLDIDDKCFDNKTIIYDVMDDILAFPACVTNELIRKKTLNSEKKLFQRADIILVSSENLKKKLNDRYGQKKSYVVNNGIVSINEIDISIKLPKEIRDIFDSNNLIKISYIGTLAEWIDYDSLLLLLDKFTDLQILLFGPYYVLPPKHSRLIVFGQVEHKYIFKIMECSDAMIMPFLVNDLIKSVNPVKLYEYIYSCKPCISVYYEEVVKFKEFTYLYNNQRELVEMVGKLIIGKLQPKSNKTEISKFCIENTWEKRTEAIFNIIELNS